MTLAPWRVFLNHQEPSTLFQTFLALSGPFSSILEVPMPPKPLFFEFDRTLCTILAPKPVFILARLVTESRPMTFVPIVIVVVFIIIIITTSITIKGSCVNDWRSKTWRERNMVHWICKCHFGRLYYHYSYYRTHGLNKILQRSSFTVECLQVPWSALSSSWKKHGWSRRILNPTSNMYHLQLVCPRWKHYS